MLRAWMREEGIGAPAVLSLAWALAAVAGSLLLWGGISHGWPRAVLLLAAAAAIRGRRAFARLGATMPMDANGPVALVGARQRWGERVQEAIVFLAAGLCAYGSGFLWIGPPLGVLAVALILAGGFISDKQMRAKTLPRPDPTLLMAMFVTAAAAEPLWGWRGQIIVLGLLAVCAVLSSRLYRRLRPAARAS
jgi:hypothetical protein